MENKQKNQVKKKVEKTSFIKKNWHIIIICVLFIFGMSQCTKSCNRNQNIKYQNKELQAKDSIIDVLNCKIDTLTTSLHYYTALYESEIKHNSNFASIATGNQNELYEQMEQLNNEIVSLKNDNITLDNRIKQLNKENSALKDSLSYYKNK